MKELVYILAPYSNGTKFLAHILTEEMGQEGGHEIMGQGPYGSEKELPWWIGQRPCVKSGYGPEEESHGQSGDGRVADVYFDWALKRYSRLSNMQLHNYGTCVMAALKHYLEGDGIFVDVNCHLADFWNCFEYMAKYEGITVRRVHLIRDGRMWAQRVVQKYKSFTGDGMHYGAVQNLETLYPYRDPRWRHESPIIQAYRYWDALHTWFMTSAATTYRLEDLSNFETAKNLLNELCPGSTAKLKLKVCNILEKKDGAAEVPHVLEPYDEAAFEEICGDTMRRAGYKWA